MPWMGSYVYDQWDEPYKIIRTPSSRKNRYQLLNDEATVPWRSDKRNNMNWTSFDVSVDSAKYEVLHSESYYVSWDITSPTTFIFTPKNNFLNVLSEFKDSAKSMCILYKLHYLDWVTDKYAIYMKPVWADVLYLTQFNPAVQELNCVLEQNDSYPRLRLLNFTTQEQQAIWNKTRINKNIRWGLLLQNKWYTKSDWNKRQMRFFVRDIVTGKIWPVSSNKFKFVKKRDCPYLPIISS